MKEKWLRPRIHTYLTSRRKAKEKQINKQQTVNNNSNKREERKTPLHQPRKVCVHKHGRTRIIVRFDLAHIPIECHMLLGLQHCMQGINLKLSILHITS